MWIVYIGKCVQFYSAYISQFYNYMHQGNLMYELLEYQVFTYFYIWFEKEFSFEDSLPTVISSGNVARKAIYMP